MKLNHNQVTKSVTDIDPIVLNVNGKEWYIWDTKKLPAHKYDIYLKNKNAAAFTDCDSRQIFYNSSLQNVRNTLWHEIFHAGACPYDATYWNSVSDADDDHKGIQNIANFIENFSRSNPEFMKWEMQ
jgi:hypothetical protein